MIGLVRELTRASLFAALSNPSIALAWRSRMKLFEGEGLDDANALRRLLQRLHHLHRALELARHDLANAEPDLAHPDRGKRKEHQREERQQGILRHHHDDEADNRQGVAREGRDEEVENAARRLRDESLPRDEFGRMGAAVVADLHPQHLVEDALLDIGDNIVGDPRQDHLLAVGRQSLDRVDGHDRRGDLPDRLEVVGRRRSCRRSGR